MLHVDLCLLHGFSGICLIVCDIYVRLIDNVDGYFLLNDFLDIASPSPAVDDGCSMGACSVSGMSGSSMIIFGGEDGGGEDGGGSVDITISEAGEFL